MIQALKGSPFTAVVHGADEGFLGDITVEVYNAATGATVLPADATGITEPRPGTYRATRTVNVLGEFIVRWEYTDDVGELVTAEEDLQVLNTLVPEVRPDAIDTPIAIEARDLLPETWDALVDAADTFGLAAIQRRHDRVIRKVFRRLLTKEEQEALDDRVIEYMGKRLAYTLLDPAIDYWSKQIVGRTAGERESSTYKDRAEDLKQLKKDWLVELGALWIDIEDLIPIQPSRVVDAPRVIQAGETVAHLTPQIDDLQPQYGPPEDVA